eukprot:c22116_g1_i1 orf=125-2218(-)
MERETSFQAVFDSPYFVHLRQLSENNPRVSPDLSPRKRSDFDPRSSWLFRPTPTGQQEVEASIGKELRPSQTQRNQSKLSFPTCDRDEAEVDLLGRTPSVKHDSNPTRSSTWTFSSEHSGLEPSLREDNVKVQTTGNSVRERTGNYVSNGETATLEHANLESSMKTDDRKPVGIRDSTPLSEIPPYNVYKSELNILQRALLASQAIERQESILARLTEAAANLQSLQNGVLFRPDNRTDNTSLRTARMHPMFYTDDWEERLVGKSKSMRAFSDPNEENELLRQALYSTRPVMDQYPEKAYSQRFSESVPLFERPVQSTYSSSCRHLIGEEVKPRTMSMRELRRWGGNIDGSSPRWVGEGHHHSPSQAYAYNSIYGRCTPIYSGGACSPNATYGVYNDPIWQQEWEDQFLYNSPHDIEAMKRDHTARTAPQFSSADARFPFCSCGVRSYLDSNNTDCLFQDPAHSLPQQVPLSWATCPVTNRVLDPNKVANYPKHNCADSSAFPRCREACAVQTHAQQGNRQQRRDQHSYARYKKQDQNGRVLAPASDPGKCHSMRYDKVSWADEQLKPDGGENMSAKIDRNRCHSSREGGGGLVAAVHCAMCGQKLEGEVGVKDDFYPRGLPLRLCASCHPAAPSSCSPPTVSGQLHKYLQRRAGGKAAAVAKSMACRPSASRKKRNGFIELCRQWMGMGTTTTMKT